MEQLIRAWHIGEHGEIFAGRCDEDGIKQFIRQECGDKDGQEQIDSLCEEIDQEEMDVERPWHFDDAPDGESEEGKSTYRKQAEECVSLPCQISTTYF